MRLPTLAMPRYCAGRSGLHDTRYGFPNRQLPAMSASQPIVHGILPPHERSAAPNLIPRTREDRSSGGPAAPYWGDQQPAAGPDRLAVGVAGWREL